MALVLEDTAKGSKEECDVCVRELCTVGYIYVQEKSGPGPVQLNQGACIQLQAAEYANEQMLE